MAANIIPELSNHCSFEVISKDRYFVRCDKGGVSLCSRLDKGVDTHMRIVCVCVHVCVHAHVCLYLRACVHVCVFVSTQPLISYAFIQLLSRQFNPVRKHIQCLNSLC